MDFASEYVYVYGDSEEECVSDQEFYGGMTENLSSDEDHSEPDSKEERSAVTSSAADEPSATRDGSASVSTNVSAQPTEATTSEPNVAASSAAAVATADTKKPTEPSKRVSMGESLRSFFNSLTKSDKRKSPSYDKPQRRVVSEATPTGHSIVPGLPPRRHQSGASNGAHSKPRRQKHHWRTKKGSATVGEANTYQSAENITGRKWRRADTNVINVKFNQLKTPSNMHTGEAVQCGGCKAVLSHISQLQPSSERDERLWRCEFCDHNNFVDVEEEEVPQTSDVTYMLEPAPSTSAAACGGEDESLVIFCVDTSGSMCVASPVTLTGQQGDSLYQQMRQQRSSTGRIVRNTMFVSRLQAVKAAVNRQLQDMVASTPHRRALLLTFNSELKVYGDCSSKPVTLEGDVLDDRERLVATAQDVTLPASIRTHLDSLKQTLAEVVEGGQTALGPALLLSVAIASRCPASKVVICTDGLANMGLGALDQTGNDEKYSKAFTFYNSITEMAVQGGVSVSVLTIDSSNSGLIELGKVAVATGGQVNKVDQSQLSDGFSNAFSDPVIATKVVARLQVHHGLYIRDDKTKESFVVRNVGNVTRSSEITFEYGVKKPASDAKPCTSKPDDGASNTQRDVTDTVAAEVKDNMANVAKEAQGIPVLTVEPPTPGLSTVDDPLQPDDEQTDSAPPQSSEASTSAQAQSGVSDAPDKASPTAGAPEPHPTDVTAAKSADQTEQREGVTDSEQAPAPPMEAWMEVNDAPGASVVEASTTETEGAVSSDPAGATASDPASATASEPAGATASEPTGDTASEPAGATASELAGATASGSDADQRQELPFQLQIEYTDLDGAKALRVITETKPVTKQREEAEKAMNMAALGAHAAQRSGQLALLGKYSNSRLNAFMYQRLLHRGRNVAAKSEAATEVYENFYSNVSAMDRELLQQQRSERHQHGGLTLSDDDDDDDDFYSCCSSMGLVSAPVLGNRGAAVPKGAMKRRMRTTDSSADVMYANVQLTSNLMSRSRHSRHSERN